MNSQVENKAYEGCNWLATLVLCFHFINAVVGISGVSIAVIGLTFVIFLVCVLNDRIKIELSAVMIVFGVLFAFFISFFRVASDITYTKEYFMNFIVFGVVALFIGLQRIDVERVLSKVLFIGAVGLPVCVVRGFEHMDDGGTMGFTYAVFPVFCCAIIVLTVFNNKKKRIVALAEITLSLYVFVSIAPRGFWLSFVFFIVCLFYYRIITGSMAKRIIFLLVVGILTVWVSQNLHDIIMFVNDTIKSIFGVSIEAFEKYLRFYDRDNVLNGRDVLWDAGVSYIEESFVFGKGIGFFESEHDGKYSHNIVIQSLCEMGILFFIPVIILLFILVKYLFFSKQKLGYKEYGYRSMLVVCGCFILFFSSVYWNWVPFWYLVGFILRLIKRQSSKV